MKENGNSRDLSGRAKRMLTSENLVSASVFVFFLVVYSITLCPAVFWWDSGELIANVAVLGIPHRPGFPIYLILAKLFSFLPLWSFALRVNLMSAFCAALSLAVLYKVFRSVAGVFFPETANQRTLVLFPGLFSLLVFGFTYSFWIQSVRAEVYSLNALFFSLLLYLCIRYLIRGGLKHVYLFFFLLGLGLGNHHLSLLSTVPALGILMLTCAGQPVLRWSRIPFCGIFLLLGFSVYLYLPIRSLAHPPLAWGDVSSVSSSAGSVFALENLRNMNFEFISNLTGNVQKLLLLFADQLTLPCFLLSLVGLLVAFTKSRKLFLFLLLLIAGNCAAVLVMATEFITTNPDLHGYLVYSVFALALAWGVGVLFLLERIRQSSSIVRLISMVALGAISLLPLARHYPQADLSRNRIAYRYGLSVISELNSNSVLFIDNVNLNFILRELQYAEGIRQDVAVIDRGLLGFGWYADQKRRNLGHLFSGVPQTVTGEPMFRALLLNCLQANKPTYMEFTERDSSLVDHLTPRGYVFKVNRNPSHQLSEEDLLRQEGWDEHNPFGLSLKGEPSDSDDDVFERDCDAQRVFALSFFRLGLFYEWKGMTSQALREFAQVARVDPFNQELLGRMRRLQQIEALEDPSSRKSGVDG